MRRYNTAMAAGLSLWLMLTLAAAQTPAPTQRMTPNFQNVDIAVLAAAIGQATGTTFIVDPRVRATVTLINPKPMTPQQLYQTFLSILQVYGFAAQRTGNVVKIVPDANIRQMPGNDLPERIDPNSDEIVTTVLEVKNISAQQLNPILRQLVPSSGIVQSVTGTNALLITDRASNVARIKKIVEELDAAGGSGVDMIPLKNSNASDVARTLTQVLAGTPAEAAAGGAPRVQADERSNSILVSGDEATRKRVATIIANLDKPVADDDNSETRYLKYALADDVATTLKQQVSTIAAATSGNAGAAAPSAAGGASAASDRSVTIYADKTTNMLIVTGPPKARQAVMNIVDKMDIPRAQVLIEAIIADVSMDKSEDIGVNWGVFEQKNGKIIPGGLFDAPVGTAAGSPIDLGGLVNDILNPSTITSIPEGATFGLGRLVNNGVSWAAMVRALAADSDTNVIASPTQVTLDNQEVNLESGQEVPFITGQFTNTGQTNNGSVNPFTTVQRQQIGTKLKITPRLNGSDAMTLTIDLESSELAGQSGDAGSAITNVRKFENVVLVKNQQWIVVGGLIRDSKVAGETRVPFLGRIPIIGELFKVRSAKRQKSNLMVFIRPTILTDSLQSTAATDQKYKEILDAQQAQGKRTALPAPKLPLMDAAPGAAPPATTPANQAPQTSPIP